MAERMEHRASRSIGLKCWNIKQLSKFNNYIIETQQFWKQKKSVLWLGTFQVLKLWCRLLKILDKKIKAQLGTQTFEIDTIKPEEICWFSDQTKETLMDFIILNFKLYGVCRPFYLCTYIQFSNYKLIHNIPNKLVFLQSLFCNSINVQWIYKMENWKCLKVKKMSEAFKIWRNSEAVQKIYERLYLYEMVSKFEYLRSSVFKHSTQTERIWYA